MKRYEVVAADAPNSDSHFIDEAWIEIIDGVPHVAGAPVVMLKNAVVNVEASDDEKKRLLMQMIGKELHSWLDFAKRNGIVITVDLEPLQPLAMRNYRMVGHVRGTR